MDIKEAQSEIRAVYLGGSVGQVVSGVLWLVSAALATWVGGRMGLVALFLGGMLIFPLTTLVIKLLGRRATLSKGNPLNQLAMQVAFTVPLLLPVILAAIASDDNWLYPAFMIVVGAHYLPFMFLYGMWQYGILAALLVGGGLLIRYFAPGSLTLGGWLTGAVLVLFGLAVGVMGRQRINE